MKAPGAIVYIDRFNLYYGAVKGTPHKWLDLTAFSRAITPSRYAVERIRYFTAKVAAIPSNPSVHVRQAAYLDALAAHCTNLEIHYGHFLRHAVTAEDANVRGRYHRVWKNEEKGSDVNLAVHLVHDAFTAGHQASVLVSNDSDLLEAVRLVKSRGIAVYWFPPLRPGRHAAAVLHKEIGQLGKIYPATLPTCQLPNPVGTPKGPVHKPTTW